MHIFNVHAVPHCAHCAFFITGVQVGGQRALKDTGTLKKGGIFCIKIGNGKFKHMSFLF